MDVAGMITAVTDLLAEFPIVVVALSAGAVIATFGLLLSKSKSIAK